MAGPAQCSERSVEVLVYDGPLSSGLHANPSACFVALASLFKAEVTVERDGNSVSGKSIMGILTLEACKGSIITIRADGPEAIPATQALCEIVQCTDGYEMSSVLRRYRNLKKRGQQEE